MAGMEAVREYNFEKSGGGDVTFPLFPYYKGREGQKNGNKFGWIEEN